LAVQGVSSSSSIPPPLHLPLHPHPPHPLLPVVSPPVRGVASVASPRCFTSTSSPSLLSPARTESVIQVALLCQST
jgi:hypothetical protein